MSGFVGLVGEILALGSALFGPIGVVYGREYQVNEWRLQCGGSSADIGHCTARRSWRSLEINLSSEEDTIGVEVTGGCRRDATPARREHRWEAGAVLRMREIEEDIPQMVEEAMAERLQGCRRRDIPDRFRWELQDIAVLLSELTTAE